jgi:hypothetical protein
MIKNYQGEQFKLYSNFPITGPLDVANKNVKMDDSLPLLDVHSFLYKSSKVTPITLQY